MKCLSIWSVMGTRCICMCVESPPKAIGALVRSKRPSQLTCWYAATSQGTPTDAVLVLLSPTERWNCNWEKAARSGTHSSRIWRPRQRLEPTRGNGRLRNMPLFDGSLSSNSIRSEYTTSRWLDGQIVRVAVLTHRGRMPWQRSMFRRRRRPDSACAPMFAKTEKALGAA